MSAHTRHTGTRHPQALHSYSPAPSSPPPPPPHPQVLHDLLSGTSLAGATDAQRNAAKDLKIRRDPERGIYVQNLSEIPLSSGKLTLILELTLTLTLAHAPSPSFSPAHSSTLTTFTSTQARSSLASSRPATRSARSRRP